MTRALLVCFLSSFYASILSLRWKLSHLMLKLGDLTWIPIKNVEYDRIRNWFEFDSKWFEMVRFLRNETDSILIRKRLENNRREKSYVIIFTLIHYFLFALSSLNCIVYLAFFTVTNFTKVSLFIEKTL